MSPLRTRGIGCNIALTAAIMAAIRKVPLSMRFRLLISAALLAASTCLFAQTPAWPPSPDHPTLPLWPNGAPGAQPAPGPEGNMTTDKDSRARR